MLCVIPGLGNPGMTTRVLLILEFLDLDPIRWTIYGSVSISDSVLKSMSEIRFCGRIRKYPFYPVIFSKTHICYYGEKNYCRKVEFIIKYNPKRKYTTVV